MTTSVARRDRGEPQQTTTLIVASKSSQSRDALATALEASGRHCIELDNYRDVCAILQSKTICVDAALVCFDAKVHISSLFHWLKRRYPHVKRLAFARFTLDSEQLETVRTCEQDTILWDCGDAARFGALLGGALARRAPRVHSSWSDLQLFRSAKGRDRRAVCEIVRRYRGRIEHLVAAAYGDRDAEDVVQEVFLRIIRTLPSYSGPCSPGHWIDRTSHATIERCSMHRAQLAAGDVALAARAPKAQRSNR